MRHDTNLNVQQNKLTRLEAIRGFVAIYVMLGHTFENKLMVGGVNLSLIFRFGQEAVIIFFLLSGFVIQYAYEKSKDKSFKLFFLKRFLRIYIPLILVFIVNYLIFAYEKGAIFQIDWKVLGGNLLMLQDAKSIKPHSLFAYFLENRPLWSLSYEWWFYMLFFFIINKFKNNASVIAYSLAVLASISYLIYPSFINRVPMYLIIWWIGGDMAMLYINGKTINIKNLYKPLAALLICILMLTLNIVINNDKIKALLGMGDSIGISPFLELRHFVFTFIAIILAIYWRSKNWLLFSKTIGLFEPFASISFGLYISHYFLVSEASYLDLIISNTVLRYICYIIICILFSYIIERIIYVRLNSLIMKQLKKYGFLNTSLVSKPTVTA